MKSWLYTLLIVGVSFTAGCGEEPPAQSAGEPPEIAADPTASIDVDGPTLRLLEVPAEALELPQGQMAVDLLYHPSEGDVGPRVVELWLGVGSGLAFESAEPLDAVTRSGKLLVARSTDEGVRLVVLSTSDLSPLEAGPVSRLLFSRTGSGAMTVSIQERMPIFAPVESNVGLSLPDMLTLVGEGAP